jgi:hypothetical protein
MKTYRCAKGDADLDFGYRPLGYSFCFFRNIGRFHCEGVVFNDLLKVASRNCSSRD